MFHCYLVLDKYHVDWFDIDAGLRSEGPVTNLLRHYAVIKIVYMIIKQILV
jgi:hypothetical protein